MQPGRAFFAFLFLAWGACIPAHAETFQVIIDQMAFSPIEIAAKVGDRIEWINRDMLVHSATVQGGWDVTIPPGERAGVVLNKPGAVAYYCRFHPNMTGGISVAPATP